MFKVIATKGTDNFTKTYNMYHNALTVGIELQNKGYKVEIKRIDK